MGRQQQTRALAGIAVALATTTLAAQELPEVAKALLIEDPAGFARNHASWDERRQELRLGYVATDDAEDRITVTVRKLVDDGAGKLHEFWRVPVTWKEPVRDAIDGRAFLRGVTDQEMGVSYDGRAGVAWHTDEWSVLVAWPPGRGGARPDVRNPRSLRNWLRARARGEAGIVPTELVRALLARFPSTLQEGERAEGPQWALAEFRSFWTRFGARLQSDVATEEIVTGVVFPFGIAFLDWLFPPDLDRDRRLAAYQKVTPWVGARKAEEFVWDRDRGAFLLSPRKVREAPRCKVGRPAVAPLPAPTACLVWEHDLPLQIGGMVSWPPLWQAGLDASGAGRVFAIEAEYLGAEAGTKMTLRKFDMASGELLASKELPFGRVSVMRWVGDRLCLLGQVPPESRDRAATIAVGDLEIVMDTGLAFVLSVESPDRRLEQMAAYLLRWPVGVVDLLQRGKAATFVRAVDAEEKQRATVYAMANDEQRAFWQVASRTGGAIVEDAGRVVVELPPGRRYEPAWASIDIATGKVVWSLAFADAGMRLAGIASGKLLFVGAQHGAVVDAQRGVVTASFELPEDTLRRYPGKPITDCVFVGEAGFVTVSQCSDGAGETKKTIRFHRWP
ncbi:MAG: hypothetical protein H6838_00745 [Planctomycetes bacterium]|nr:hypothetical protein [Planctomycetota bacterium]